MRAFTCPDCLHLVLFESLECLNSNTVLGFDWDQREIVALPDGLACANREEIGCNGVASAPNALCFSCAFTRTRPTQADDGPVRFAKAEAAKRRLLFELLELGLPVESYLQRKGGLAFDMLNSERTDVITGHDDGLITLDLAEADDVHRERVRTVMGEPYRTLLGHMRHEIAHYYEPILCPQGSAARDRYREFFGDERADYQAAMDRHYAEGAPDGWPDEFVSAYATMHPWEDWAETFAHYLHIRDSLQTAITYGVSVAGSALLLPGRGWRRDSRADGRVATADLRAQRDEPQHGRRRHLPVRAATAGDRQARLHRRTRERPDGLNGLLGC